MWKRQSVGEAAAGEQRKESKGEGQRKLGGALRSLCNS